MKKTTIILFLLCLCSTGLVNSQIHLTEGFESGTFPPSGWASFRGTNGLGTGYDWVASSTANLGSAAAYNRYENVTGGVAEDWLVTSQIDLTSSSNAELLFYSRQTYGPNYGSNYEVKVSTTSQTNHSDFTTVASYTETTIGGGSYELKTVDLSAYDGMMIYVAFVHLNDDGDDWYIDDIEVRSPLALDAKINSVGLNRYSLTSTDNQLTIDVNNNGVTVITSLAISWGDGTNSYSENFSVNIASGQTQTISHSTQVNYSSVDEKNITATITSVNGGADGDVLNNSFNTMFNTLSQLGTKRVVIEEATGTWCGWCPRGAVGLDYITSTYSDAIGIAVHNGNNDPMVVTEYDNGVSAQVSGYPSSIIDRTLLGVNPASSSLETAYNELIPNVVPVDLSSSASITTGSTISIDVNATFYSNFSAANYRLAAVITEDNVTGTTSGYNQANYYSGGGNGPMGGYESLPNPVPAAQMVYDHVGRALLGGFDGQANSVPTTLTDGQMVSQNFSYTIPSTSDQANMHIVALLIDASNGKIVSGFEQSIAQALSTQEFNELNGVKIYPNPVANELNISLADSDGDYSVSITDILGRTIINTSYNNLFGNQSINLPLDNLKSGHYILRITNNNSKFTTRFIKK